MPTNPVRDDGTGAARQDGGVPRRGSRLIWALVGALVAACGADPAPPTRLELTPGSGHQSVVLAAGPVDSGPLVAWNLEDPLDEPLLLPWPEQGDLQVTALFYSVRLDELGLAPGALRRTEDGLALPAPDGVQRAALRPGDTPQWTDAGPGLGELGALRVARDAPCAQFSITFFDLPFQSEVAAVIAVSEREAWVLALGGTLWRADAAGGFAQLATGLPDGTAVAGGPGQLWVGGSGGRLVGLEIDGDQATITSSAILPTEGRIEALALAPGGRAPVFALTAERRFLGRGAQGWQVLAAIDEDVDDVRGLAAISPDEAVFGFYYALVAYRWKANTLRTEPVPINSFRSGITAIAYWPGFGTVIGSGMGELMVQTEGGDVWTKLAGAYAVLNVESLVQYERGFLYTDESGVVVQYAPGVGFCPVLTPPLEATAEGRVMSGFGLDLVSAGTGRRGAPPAQIFWYHREVR